MAQHELEDVFCFLFIFEFVEVILGYLDLSKKISWRNFLHVEGIDLAESLFVMNSHEGYNENDCLVANACGGLSWHHLIVNLWALAYSGEHW